MEPTEKEEFLKRMENLQVPDLNPESHQRIIKLAVLNSSRSAVLGVWLIVVPCYFLFCVFMYYYYFHAKWGGVFSAMINLMADLDKNPVMKFLSPVILVVLPIVSIIINALSIIHVQYPDNGPGETRIKEFSITVKIKIWNILLIFVSLAIVCMFVGYVIVENITIRK